METMLCIGDPHRNTPLAGRRGLRGSWNSQGTLKDPFSSRNSGDSQSPSQILYERQIIAGWEETPMIQLPARYPRSSWDAAWRTISHAHIGFNDAAASYSSSWSNPLSKPWFTKTALAGVTSLVCPYCLFSLYLWICSHFSGKTHSTEERKWQCSITNVVLQCNITPEMKIEIKLT